jgi:carboxyl-terminal processing protease
LDRKFQQVKDPIVYKISEERSDGTKVGYIQIAEFNSLVKAKLEDAFRELQNNKGANAFVLDLRGNPGGAFQSAVEISSLFVDNRVATYVVDSNGVELPFKTMSDRVVVDPKAPVAIWVDGGSASASEVLAGSLHDNCRAVIMGKQSFGKGLIQAVYGLKNGAGLVLTVARYVTPNGTEIHGKGVTPDISGGVPLNLPIVGTDTSKVDFGTISKRLDPSMCQVPTPHGG